MRALLIWGLVAAVGLAACGGDEETVLPPDASPPDGSITPVAPTQVSSVASQGFEGPMDAVASPDGQTFYFSAHTAGADSEAALFSVPSAGGTAEVMVSGPPLEDPTGLLLSCDGSTLYVADLSYSASEADDPANAGKAAIFTLDVAQQTLTPLDATGVGEAASLAFDPECQTLYVSGYTPEGAPAVFTLSPEGGAATVLKQGAPLESPSGVYVDRNDIVWLMDHRLSSNIGGVLWAIDADGQTSPVVEDLRISEPAGVSLVAGGDIAVIPSRNDDGEGQLITVHTETGESTIVDAPMILEPAGIRTAIDAPVMAVVDADGNAIYRAE